MNLSSAIAYIRERGTNGPHFPDLLEALTHRGQDVLNLRQFGTSGTDQTKAFQRAASEANDGKIVVIPPGNYRISDTIDWGAARIFGAGMGTEGTAIDVLGGGGFKLSGSYSEVSNIHFNGRFAGAIAVQVGVANKPLISRCVAERFTLACFVFSGAQNMMVYDCHAKWSKYGYWVTNNTRNLCLLNCISEDRDVSFDPWLTQAEPDSRALLIGQKVNSYIPQLDENSFVNTPGKIVVRSGIFEDYGRHDYLVEITHAYDHIILDNVELTEAKTAYLRLGPKHYGKLVLREPLFRSSAVPLILNQSNRTVVATNPISGGGAPEWEG